jgi:hypothetical protein
VLLERIASDAVSKAMTSSESVGVDAEIARYESMSEAEVGAELRQYGIDPKPHINAVKRLVAQQRRKDFRSRRK